jgi:hypothetical protein
MSVFDHTCPACGRDTHLTLCVDCETAYQAYVENYEPHRSHPGGTKTGYFRMSEPQTRHQWAAHQKKASQ